MQVGGDTLRKKQQQRLPDNGLDGSYGMYGHGYGTMADSGLDLAALAQQAHMGGGQPRYEQQGVAMHRMYEMQQQQHKQQPTGIGMGGSVQGQGQFHYMNQAAMGGDISGHGGLALSASQGMHSMPGSMQHHAYSQPQAGQGYPMHGGAHAQQYGMGAQPQLQAMASQAGRPKTQTAAATAVAANSVARPADSAVAQAHARAPGQAAAHASEPQSAPPQVSPVARLHTRSTTHARTRASA